ncbi:MAG TPA: helix-turn-helix domain-containing protein [Acidimicrobiales bacterium]|nr:helix-turn-helix domain-containing protein [Acidimicrobiales bacterium]
MDRQTLIRVLADRSRHSVYQSLAGGSGPATIGEIADRLDLHPSTVRLHLEKLRDAGLVEAAPDRHGSVGRPQLLWRACWTGPSLGLEPGGIRMLAHLLADLAALDPAASERARDVGRRRAAELLSGVGTEGPRRPAPGGGVEAAVDRLAQLGFDPAVESGPSGDADGGAGGAGGGADGREGRDVIAFTSCPFRELAVLYPDLVCQLHRGLTAALLEEAGVTLEGFSTLVDPDPCRAEISINA